MSDASSFHRARRMGSIQVSEIVQLSEKAAAMRRAGNDVIGLGTGEPDFDTPEHVVEAAYQAARSGDTKYAVTGGSPALKAAVRERYARDHGIEVENAEVIVSTGAKQVLFNAFMATLDEGDEVIIPAPYWTSYVDMVQVAGGVPRTVDCSMQTSFKMTPDALESAIRPNTRWLLLNTPSNPTGAGYSPGELRALADVLVRHPQVWLVADEIYEHIVYEGFDFRCARNVAPELAERTLIVNGVSKAYAMTGWRIGFGIGPQPLVATMTSVQGQITSGACSISQAAAVAALTGPQDLVEERRAEFQQRRDLVVAALNEADGLYCPTPDGAFYVFPSCADLVGRRTPDGTRIEDAADFCAYLLDTQGVVVVPGRAFGSPHHFRISYAYSRSQLEEACARIRKGCEALG